MQSYAELEKAFKAQKGKKKLDQRAESLAKDVFIANQFLEDHKIQLIPLARAKAEAAAALEEYPPEEKAKFADTMQRFFKTLQTIHERFKTD